MLEFDRIVIEYVKGTEDTPAKLGFFKDTGEDFEPLIIHRGKEAEMLREIIETMATKGTEG